MLKNKKIISIAILCSILIGFTAAVCGYWASKVNNPADDSGNGSVIIGEGDEVETKITLGNFESDNDENKVLIPNNYTAGEGETTSVQFTAEVKWDEINDSNDSKGEIITKYLDVNCTEIVVNIGEDSEESLLDANLFLIEIIVDNASMITLNSDEVVNVIISIELNEPANKEQYELITNNEVTFTFTFSIVDELQ